MQPQAVTRAGLINGTATAANINSAKVVGNHIFLTGDAGAGGEQVLPPIRKGSIREVITLASSPEKQQMVLVGTVAEVIAAGKSYSISMQFPRDRFDGAMHDRRIFRAKLDVLGADAASDRKKLYGALASKVNAYVPNYTKAAIGFTYTTKSTGARTIEAGTLLYLVGGTYVAIVTKAVTMGVKTTVGSIELADYSGTRPSGATDMFALASAGGTAVSETESSYTSDTSLVLVDEAGYFPTKERLGRGGAPTIFSSGFAAQPFLLQAHSYSNGIGKDMLAHMPSFDLERQNMTAGRWENQYSDAPVSGSTYTHYVIRYVGGGTPDAMDGRNADILLEHNLFVKETTAGTAIAAFKNAIEALV